MPVDPILAVADHACAGLHRNGANRATDGRGIHESLHVNAFAKVVDQRAKADVTNECDAAHLKDRGRAGDDREHIDHGVVDCAPLDVERAGSGIDALQGARGDRWLRACRIGFNAPHRCERHAVAAIVDRHALFEIEIEHEQHATIGADERPGAVLQVDLDLELASDGVAILVEDRRCGYLIDDQHPRLGEVERHGNALVEASFKAERGDQFTDRVELQEVDALAARHDADGRARCFRKHDVADVDFELRQLLRGVVGQDKADGAAARGATAPTAAAGKQGGQGNESGQSEVLHKPLKIERDASSLGASSCPAPRLRGQTGHSSPATRANAHCLHLVAEKPYFPPRLPTGPSREHHDLPMRRAK